MKAIVVFLCLFVAAAAQAQKCAPPPVGMTAWWAFSETAGAVSHDTVLTDNAATQVGGVTRQAGVVGQALCFNGTTGFATAADHPELDFNNGCPTAEPLVIDFWVRTKQLGVVVLLDKREWTPTFLRGYSVFLVNGRPAIQLATGPGSQICGSSPSAACTNEAAPASIADGKWHFVAIRVSPRCGPQAMGTIFVDGAVVHTFKPRQGDLGNKAPLNIGRRDPALGVVFFNGCLDEVEIIKRPLTDAELLAIFKAGPLGKCKPCVVPPSVCPPGKPKVGDFKSPTGVGWGTGTYAVCLAGPPITTSQCLAEFHPEADHRCDDYKGFGTITDINGKKYCVFNRTDSTYYNAREIKP